MQEPGSSWAVGVLRTLKKLINHKKNIMLKVKHGPERTGLPARTKFSLAHCSTRRAKIR
jgi:hypothetical protein